jgi:hypothetical protein
MRRRGVWRRRVTRAVATLVVGGLLGFLIPTIYSDMTAQQEAQAAATAESPVARRFIDAFTTDDQPTLESIGAGAAVQAKAARFKAEYAKVDKPVHLGSWVITGGRTLHAYSAHVVDIEGGEDQLAWRVLTVGGAVGLVDPPPSTQTP